MRLLAQYGAPASALFQSHLCADNARFEREPEHPKVHDLLFCGRFVDVKNPLFAMDVASASARLLGRRVSLAFLGAGELEPQMRAHALTLSDVDVQFLGFAQPDALPGHFKRSRIFLFPTSWDPWGVVANEACVAGVPVLATAHAGAAGEIIRDGVNGAVLPLDVQAWAQAVCRLLQDEDLYRRQSEAGRQLVKGYTFEAAAKGLCDAVDHAMRVKV
jgi:glycosyltransferase involved in cell wall biosynthesis